jgi:uncharacterized membrane protein YdbT with pleckstrin-like domain
MLDSVNLPLDRKKIVKKTLKSSLLPLILFLFSILLIIAGIVLNDYALLTKIGIGVLIVSLLPVIITYIYQTFYFKLYSYKFEEASAEISKGVFSRSTGHVRYQRIQNIFLDQDVFDLIFGLYDVHYETAGEVSGIYSHVDGLNKQNAEKLIAFLKDRLNNVDAKQSAQAATSADPVLTTKDDDTSHENETVIVSRASAPLSKKLVFAMSLTGRSLYALIAIVYTGFQIVNENNYQVGNVVLGIVILIILVIGGLILYNILWFKNFNFSFSNKSGMIIEQVIAKSQVYIYYDRIQNINIKQSVLERLLGIYAVSIETAAGGAAVNFTIPGLKNADATKIKEFLQEKLAQNRNRI